MLPKLKDIIEAFEEMAPSEKLDVLVEFGENLRPLETEFAVLRDAGEHMITECRAPVFLLVEADKGVLRIHGDVPREAPVARGFVALLISVFDGIPTPTPQDVPSDLVTILGLHDVLSMQRRRGLSAVYHTLYRQVSLAFDDAKR